MALRIKILSILCFLILFQASSSTVPSKHDLSNLLNLLGQKYSNNKAVLVILDSGSNRNDKDQIYRSGSSDTSDDDTANIAHLLLQQKAKKLLPMKTWTTKSVLPTKNNVFQLQRLKKLQDNRESSNKNALRSPIIKKLLRISNRIQCNAKDNCQDKCSDKFKGNKVVKCNLQCEIKYECDEEEKDSCGGGDCADSCGNSAECLMSTRGIRLVTEEPKCKRC